MRGIGIIFYMGIALSGTVHAQTCNSLLGSPVKVYRTQVVDGTVQALLTQPDLGFKSCPTAAGIATFLVNPSVRYQKMNGFGGAITESCAMNLNRLDHSQRATAMTALFSKANGAGFDYLRLPMGSTDFSDPKRGHYTYDDSPNNVPDPGFTHFDMSRDNKSLALIRRAKQINPDLRVIITPWSPPAWMKTPASLLGGSLNPQHYQDYANYFVRVIHEYQKHGVPVASLTIQNEPGYPNADYPSMGMTNDEQVHFIKDFLAPTLRREHLPVDILMLDHNYDMVNDVNAMLADPEFKKSVGGTAYHCYGGDISQMLGSIQAHPDIPVLQTECSTLLTDSPDSSKAWWLGDYALKASNIGSTGSIAWNICLDETGGPHNKGCDGCSGIITTDFSKSKPELHYSQSYFALAQISRFIHRGARRIEVTSSTANDLTTTAFVNQDNGVSFVAWNPTAKAISFRVERPGNQGFEYTLDARNAVTFTW